MTSIKLTDAQVEKLAIAWIKGQRKQYMGYKKVLDPLIGRYEDERTGWDAVSAVTYAAKKVSKECLIRMQDLLELVGRAK